MLQLSGRGEHAERQTPLTQRWPIAQLESAMHTLGLVEPPSLGALTHTPLLHT